MRQVVEGGLLPGHDHVHVVAAAQAMVRHRQQAIGVGRQVNPYDFGLLVDHMVDETGVLVGEAVVVLAPYVRGQQVVERRQRPAPGDAAGRLQPFRVLVEHRVDDVDERLIAGEQAVPPGQQITFQPALALVLGQHLHDPPLRGQVVVGLKRSRLPLAIGDFEDGLQAVRGHLVRAEQPEIASGWPS